MPPPQKKRKRKKKHGIWTRAWDSLFFSASRTDRKGHTTGRLVSSSHPVQFSLSFPRIFTALEKGESSSIVRNFHSEMLAGGDVHCYSHSQIVTSTNIINLLYFKNSASEVIFVSLEMI